MGYRLAAHAHSSYSRKSAFPAELTVETGQPVPGRAQWILARPLDASSNSEVWLAEHPKTRELRVFKFVADGSRLATLKREVTVFRFLRESRVNVRILSASSNGISISILTFSK